MKMKLGDPILAEMAASLATSFFNGVRNCCVGEKADLAMITDVPWAVCKHDRSTSTAFNRAYTFFFYTGDVESRKLERLKDVFQRREIQYEEGEAGLLDIELPQGWILFISDPEDTPIIANAVHQVSMTAALD